MFRTIVLAVFFGALSLSAPAQDAAAPAVTPSATPAPSTAPPSAAAASPAAAPAEPAATATATPTPKPASNVSIEIDLGHQRAYLIRDGKKISESPISSGRAGHLTPTGDFSVTQKDRNHFSNLYGSIVDASGRTVIAGADAAMAIPRGCHFKAAAMKNFLRFEGAAGMHAGILPGYPASHGCVRMPADKARLFFQTAEMGTPVHVFGTTPTRSRGEAASTSRLSKAERSGHTEPKVKDLAPMPGAAPSREQPARRGWFHFSH